MTFAEAVAICLRKYVTFSGRARRAEFWYFQLFTVLVQICAGIVDSLTIGGEEPGLFSSLLTLALFLPTLSVGVRRLHDIGRTGWWLVLLLLPLIGIIVLLVFFVQRGEAGTNLYGPDPLADPGGRRRSGYHGPVSESNIPKVPRSR